MNAEQTEKVLKERGFWQIRLYPSSHNPNLISPVSRCIEIIKSASIHSRGWDYPHIATDDGDRQNTFKIIGDRIESWTNWGMHKEICRFYQNGQFLHYFTVFEDWYKDDPRLADYKIYTRVEIGAQIDPTEIIYRITEIYLFIKNLINQEVYSTDLNAEISLHNTNGRQLVTMNPARHLSMSYICHADKVWVPKRVITMNASESDILKYATDDIQYLFEQFQWTDSSRQLIEDEQQKLIQRKI